MTADAGSAKPEARPPLQADPVMARLLASRLDLLDLSLRNPLLNYRPSRRRGVEVVDEKAGQIFAVLVVERQPLRFHPTKASEEKPRGPEQEIFWVDEDKEGERTPGELGVGEANPPGSLATAYSKEALAQRLLDTHYDAWLTLQEQGANTLFLAVGMLRWREADEATEDRLAPLVLIPVRLERKSARSSWQLAALDEDPGVNLSLVEKLKEFAIKLPAALDLETVEGLEDYLTRVEQAVAEKSQWAVERNRIVLGFFSFGKFLMYRDLDPENWPEERHPRRHAVLSALLLEGFREMSAAVAPEVSMDELRPPGTTMEVMDTDSSQADALAEVASGRNLVIQGPPGTGKSQTISNMIAEAVYAGKKVLFVAEKLAALEVVKRRLDNIGLGALCLELHSNKASKKELAGELGRTLALGKPQPPEEAEAVEGLVASREKLNRYARAVAQPVGPSGMTPYQAIGILERLKAHPEPVARISTAPFAEWTRAQFVEARAQVQDLTAKIAEIGTPARHPFEGCGLVQVLPGDEEKIGALLQEAEAGARAVAAAAGALARSFEAGPAGDMKTLEAWCALATLALEAPDLTGIPPIGPVWDRREAVEALAGAAERAGDWNELRQSHETRLLPQAWNEDIKAARDDLVMQGSSWWRRLFSGRYKAAKTRIQALCALPPPKKFFDLAAVADLILRSQRLKTEIEERAETCRTLVGARWRGLESRLEELRAVREWALRFRTCVIQKKLPASLAEWAVGNWDREELRRSLTQARAALDTWRAAWTKVGVAVAYPCDGRPGLPEHPFASGIERAGIWRGRLGLLPSYVAYGRLSQGVSRLGLAELAARAHQGEIAPAGLGPALEQAWAHGILERAFRERAELRDFDAVTHEQVVERFRAADAAVFAVNRARLAELHWRSLPGGVGYGQIGLVRHECGKKTRHLPIRRLMEQAGRAVGAIKPVFLMSPLSVAAYLPSGGPTFDLVIFDEASQVRPVDAFGAALRGRQLVVVGDEKQLPPTSFFDALLSPEGVRDDDEEGGTNVTRDMQSILGLCAAKGMPSKMLRWHYRSRHDSLIALSNHEFYEDHLVIFPSPFRRREGEGLVYRHLPQTVYERGTSRTNPLEADAVAAAVLEHSRARPDLSLGVVAFSQAQRAAIENRIEALRRKYPEFDAFVSANREEPFFVKNLENVQGDERDVMLISVGYGRDAQGGLSMNFGPLNQAGGERRLNVLITRARRQCVAFTNITPDDLDLRRASGAGVRSLKAFLAFARDGALETAAPPGPGQDSDFEAQVYSALAGLGLQVEAQVGSGGYRVDLAVADPAVRGCYLLGVECDGAPYQTARWARDRDRLRESVLHDLGWTLHRVWSADWFRNREQALGRCAAALERARKGGSARASRPPLSGVKRTDHFPPPGREPVPRYKAAKTRSAVGDAHLADIQRDALADFIAGIVEEESPVPIEEVRRRVLDTVDARPGSRRLAAIDEAMALAASRGLVHRRGEFLWGKAERPITPRDRSALPDISRGHELVCDEELRAALLRVVDEACGCDRDEAASQAIRLLGVKRNEESLARFLGLLEEMTKDGTLQRTASGALGVPR